MWRHPLGACALFTLGCRTFDGVLVEESVYAPELDTHYTQAVYTPPGADTGPGAPWVLLLDGDVWTDDAATQLDRAVRRGDADPVIVVGIGRQRTRTRDYTPYPSDGVAPASEGAVGAIDAFFAWLVDDWLPAWEASTGWGGDRASRTLMGHSYGGLATAWAMFHRGASFGCYGTVSPSLWWDDGAAFVWEADRLDARVSVVYGAVEPAGIAAMASEWADLLRDRPDVVVEEHRFEGDDHVTVARRRAWGAVFEACR